MAQGTPPDAAAGRAPSFLRSDWLVGLLLLAATLIAYHGVWHAGLIWDDDGHVTRPELRSLHGLWRIWFEPGATQQYYPLLHSAFWAEHRLWGDRPLGYHLANVVLHSTAAYLLYRVLRLVSLPGAFLAALVFALHPVCVESVAWVSEQKNTLSAVFYLAAAIAYLRFEGGRRAGWYVLGTALFAMALASKTVTATLPAALLVVVWWRRGRLAWRGDVLPLVPWICLGAAGGAVTAWAERTLIGTKSVDFRLGVADRFLVAGRAVWFYLGKLVWPADLTFIYPHWRIDAHAAAQYLFPAAVLGVLAALYALRKRGRGPLAAALLFTGTLSPALGFFNVYPFVYSYVADHFQYLAAAMAISAACAAFVLWVGRLSPGARTAAWAAAACVVAVLAALTSRQCAMYADVDTLWQTTVARNPSCWMAFDNLGSAYMNEGRVQDAILQYRGALAAEPNDVIALNLLGVALLQERREDEAVAQFRRAMEINPDFAETHNNLGIAFLQKGQIDEAISHYKRALEISPKAAPTEINMGYAYLLKGNPAEASAHFQRALDLNPDSAEAHNKLANILRQNGQVDAAITHYRRALEIVPTDIEANNNLGVALLEEKRTDEAAARFQRALEIDPSFAKAHINLANILMGEGREAEAIVHYQKALAADPGNAKAHNNLGFAYLHEGRVDEAVAEFQAALKINPDYSEAKRNLGIALGHKAP
jgi:tetratricopeptide (TPR) repeat protein